MNPRNDQPKPDANNDPEYQQFLAWKQQQGGQHPIPPPPPPQVVYVQQAAAKKKSGGAGCGTLLVIAIIVIAIYSANSHKSDTSSGTNSTGIGSSAPIAPQSSSFSLTYKVSGTASSASVTYDNATGGTEQHTVSVPWQQTYRLTDSAIVTILAQNQGDSGSITCQILVNGSVVKESTSSGAYVIATCSGDVGPLRVMLVRGEIHAPFSPTRHPADYAAHARLQPGASGSRR